MLVKKFQIITVQKIGLINSKEYYIILKKIIVFHSDIKPDNLLVKNKRLYLIDFAQSIKISDLKKYIS